MKRAICFLLAVVCMLGLAMSYGKREEKTHIRLYGSYNLNQEVIRPKSWLDMEISYEEWREIWETRFSSPEREMWLQDISKKNLGEQYRFRLNLPRIRWRYFLAWEEEKTIPKRIWTERYVGVDVARVYTMDGQEFLYTVTYTQKLKTAHFNDGYMFWFNDSWGYLPEECLLTAEELLKRDKHLLASIGAAEALGVGEEEMLRVMEVLINRVASTHEDFDDVHTLQQVLDQPGQYPDTRKRIAAGTVQVTQEALKCAEKILVGDYERQFPADCLWQCGFEPTWNVRVIYVSECGHYYAVPAK